MKDKCRWHLQKAHTVISRQWGILPFWIKFIAPSENDEVVGSFCLHCLYSWMQQVTGDVPGRNPISNQRGQYPLYLGKFLLWMRTIIPTNSKSSGQTSSPYTLYFLTKQLNFWKVWFFVYIQFHHLRNVLIHQKESKVNAWHARLRNGESESTQGLLCFHLPLCLEAQIYCRSHHRWTATNWFPKTLWYMTGSYEIIPTFPYNFISMHSLNSD